jgi:hypothetical protein
MALTKSRLTLITYLRHNYADAFGSVAEARMTRALDNALRRMRERDWAFLTGTTALGTTELVDSAGTDPLQTCNIASFSARTLVDFANLTLPADIVGQYIEINGEQGWYEITERVAGGQLRISRPYTGALLDESAGTAAPFRILYSMVDLPPNYRKLVNIYPVEADDKMRFVPTPGAWWLQAWYRGVGKPDRYSIVYPRQDPNRVQLMLYPAPTTGRDVYEVVYVRDPGWYSTNVAATATWKRESTADTDYLDWPDRHMDVFYKAALVSLYEEEDPQGKLSMALGAFMDAAEGAAGDDNPGMGIGRLSSGYGREAPRIDVEIENAEFL